MASEPVPHEEIIDPGLPICDPHHHLWDRDDDIFPTRRYLLDELLHDTGSGHAVVTTVFVDCRSMYRRDGPVPLRPVGETEFVEATAVESERRRAEAPGAVIAGIVGHADLRLGAAVDAVLEGHLTASPTRFRGIRHIVSWDATGSVGHRNTVPPGLLLDETFREGFSRLRHHGLSFDAWLYQPQLPDLVDLARAFPETTIVLNHTGGPLGVGPYGDDRAAAFRNWQQWLARLATCPNVVVKLGGLGMAFCGFGWHARAEQPGSVELAAAMQPYYLSCIEQFGVERCMFESNFPVDRISYPYDVLWNAFKRIATDFSPSEKAAVFHDTAVRTYRLR